MLQKGWLLLLITLLLVTTIQAKRISFTKEHGVKQAVYRSWKFVLRPGSVSAKYFWNADFPRGHIAIKEFTAEIVDKAGNPVPLHEVYIHDGLMQRYYTLTTSKVKEESEVIWARNSSTCKDNILGQHLGFGSETRRTDMRIPKPYGIEFGKPADIPDGYKEQWRLHVHAIDTRGVVDRMGCTECRCDLYNVTVGPDYLGGLGCCADMNQCRLKEGFRSKKRNLYLRYTVKWVDWAHTHTVLPVKVYVLDVTDSGNNTVANTRTGCQVEYQVLSCDVSGASNCIDSKKTNIVMPKGGYVIYGVGHQNAGAIGTSLYGADGRLLCSSTAIYGKGHKAGNEAGYVVRMTTCYPQPGSVKIYDGETVTLKVNYNSNKTHTGVMGLFYLLLADKPGKA